MTVKELRDVLNDDFKRNEGRNDAEEISVILALPSMGPRAHSKVKWAGFGFDWDRGLQFETEARLVPKSEKQDIWEAGYELLSYIATKPAKKQSYEIRTAERIFRKYGRDDEWFAMVRRVMHKDFALKKGSQ